MGRRFEHIRRGREWVKRGVESLPAATPWRRMDSTSNSDVAILIGFDPGVGTNPSLVGIKLIPSTRGSSASLLIQVMPLSSTTRVLIPASLTGGIKLLPLSIPAGLAGGTTTLYG